jgi:DNA-binding response OmpR family regulator
VADSARPVSVLLIDGFADEAEMYADYLRASGLVVYVSGEPDEAIELASDVVPSVIVTRLRQPGRMSGHDITRCLRDRDLTRDVSILMITTSIDPADRETAFHAGCDQVLVLPVLPDTLLAEIRRLARRIPRPPLAALTSRPIGRPPRPADQRRRRTQRRREGCRGGLGARTRRVHV